MRSRTAAVALVAALAACGKSSVTPPGVGLSQPSSVAAFHGIAGTNANVDAYLAIANQGANDLTILSATNDASIEAPVVFRTLVIPADRPTLLVSAHLSDEPAGGPAKPDLLVAVAAGSSSAELIDTWTNANEIAADVELGGEALAAAVVPTAAAGTTTTPGTARVAFALAGGRIAFVDFTRDASSDAVRPGTPVVSGDLGFQPVSLATIPGVVTNRVYAATRDAIAPGVFGVAEIDLAASFAVRALDARGPTRLVGAASLRERLDPIVDPAGTAPGTAFDETAFTGKAAVDRVYAVLDESGCGPSERIDCGVAVIDPCTSGVAGECKAVKETGGLLPDPSGRMPYMAPIPLPARPVAFAVSPPPANPPSTAPEDAKYSAQGPSGPLMRIWPALGAEATTAVGAVACANGITYFLDLARWKVANDTDPFGVAGAGAVAVTAPYVDLPVQPPATTADSERLWIVKSDGSDFEGTTAGGSVTTTPGYTRTVNVLTSWQGLLPQLSGRGAEAGLAAPGSVWLALQQPGAVGITSVVRLWDPALGVHVGDIVSIDAAAVQGCVGTSPPSDPTSSTAVFEARVAELLAPTAAYPGGAVRLEAETTTPAPAPATDVLSRWTACLDALAAQAQAASPVTGLTASFRASAFVTTSDAGYLGRPAELPTPTAVGPTWQFTLEYPPAAGNEDVLDASCPLSPWPADPSTVACDDACRATCEALSLARKSRRIDNVSGGCNEATDPGCTTLWPGLPDIAGPTVSFRFAVQAKVSGSPQNPAPARGMTLTTATSSGVSPFGAGTATGQGALAGPAGAIAFDRSVLDPPSGYRFLVPYSGNWVLDATPSADKGAPIAIH